MCEQDQGVTPSGPGSRPSDGAASSGVSTVPASIPNAVLLDLVERCEKATGPDQDLDEAIFDMAWPVKSRNGLTWRERGQRMLTSDAITPRYTASIDAAMSLVQPNWWVNVSGPMSPAAYGYSREDERRPRAGVEMLGHPYSAGAHAATHALALTAACLRALAAQAIEARRAETGTGSVHESAVPKGCAQGQEP